MSTSRVWFITGTSSGLGKNLVETVLRSSPNERVVATSRSTNALSYLRSEYPPERLLLQKMDVTNPQDVKQAFEAALKAFGGVDVVGIDAVEALPITPYK